MRTTLMTSAALLFAIADSAGGCAQTAAQPPTTRILAIGTVNPGVDLATVRAILPAEVKERDRNGVAFILNGSDVDAAAAMLERPHSARRT